MSFFKELKRRNVIRVAVAYLALAWLLIEVSGTLFPGFGIPDWAFRLVVVLLALGFVPVLVFSWAFEITPDGVRREQDVVRPAGSEQRTARRLDVLTISLIVVALIFIVADRMWLDQRSMSETLPVAEIVSAPETSKISKNPAALDSIAVLPFVNRSANPEDSFFVDGIHDDLLTYISQIGALKTISRTSVMKYRESTLSIPEIAAELGVSTVLEGGVQRAGNQVRINVQLIDARNDDHLWSQIYDRQLTASNVFAIQSEIAEAIAGALRATLSPEEQARIRSVPTENLEALESYFLGKQHMALRRGSDLLKAAEFFETAVGLDPEFALAWVGLADTWMLQFRGLSREQALENSKRAAERALQINPNLGEALAADAKRRDWQGDLEGSERAFKRALQLAPNYAPGYQWYGQMLQDQPGRIEEALAMHRKATQLDPQSAIIFNDYAGGLLYAGQVDEALKNFQQAVEIEPRFTRGYWGTATVQALYKAQWDRALVAARSAVASDPEPWNGYANVGDIYLNLGEAELANDWLAKAQALAPAGTVIELECLLLGYSKDVNAAWECAHRSLEANPESIVGLVFIRDQAFATGDFTAARQLFARGYPELFADQVANMSWRQRTVAVHLAHLLVRLNESDQAEYLLDQAMISATSDGAIPQGELAMHLALTHSVRNDKPSALAALREAVDKGWRNHAWYHLQFSPLLSALHDFPEFQALEADIKSDLSAQLARVKEWETNGELAPIPNN